MQDDEPVAEHVYLEAGDDLVSRLSFEREPVKAVIELIWNALDADATSIDIALERNATDSVDKVVVTDNGDGMSPEEARSSFRRVGSSWKATSRFTQRRGRPLHGRNGMGRLRAFAVGNSVRWVSTARTACGTLMRTTIASDISRRTQWEIDSCDVSSTTDETGTVVELWGKQSSRVDRLTGSKVISQLNAALAPHLLMFPEVQLTYDGSIVDPRKGIFQETSGDLEFSFDESSIAAEIRLIEWRPGIKEYAIALCDSAGVPIEMVEEAPNDADFPFTAYVSWDGIVNHRNDVALITLGGDTPLRPLLDAARVWMASHFEERRRSERRNIVVRWIGEGVYPYPAEVATGEEQAEQATFDLVATSISRHISGDRTKKRLTLSLLRNALRHDPKQMIDILNSVLSLDPTDAENLHSLLQQTSLSSIIRASSVITARLQFLAALSHVVFDHDAQNLVNERDHLHKILERELWVFGEEYNMMTSSEIGLTRALEHHRRALGMDATPDGSVRLANGHVGRLDLMLSGRASEHERYRHLVVELKAPSVVGGREQISQIEDYMEAVTSDPRFNNLKVTWDFVLVVSSMDDKARSRSRQAGRPEGLISEPDLNDFVKARAWVRTWSEVISEAERRLDFIKNDISHHPSLDEALEYLRTRHGDVVPRQLLRNGSTTATASS